MTSSSRLRATTMRAGPARGEVGPSASAAAIYAGLTLGALATLAPFALGLLTSFTSAHQFATGTPLSLPLPPTLSNYADLGGAGFGRALAATTLMTAVILLGQVTSSVLAA